MKTPVTRETLRQHLTYSWWKYVLLAALSFFLIDLLYTTTAYRTPADKRVDFYIYGYANEEELNAYMEKIRKEQMPDMEEMSCQLLMADDNYGPMQLSTYMAVGEGDLYLLPRDQFISLASQSALLPLEDQAKLVGVYDQAGLSLQNGWRRETETGETHLYGIPLSKLPGLVQYAYAQDGYLSVLAAGGNDENTIKFLTILSKDMITEPEPASPAPETESPPPEAAETAAP